MRISEDKWFKKSLARKPEYMKATRITIFALGAAALVLGLLMLLPVPYVLIITGSLTCLFAASPRPANPKSDA